MTEVTPVFCDWVTAVGLVAGLGSWLRKTLNSETMQPINGAFSHTQGVEYIPSGWKHYTTPGREDGQSVLLLTGEPLARIRRNEGNDFASKVVGMIAHECDHFSRLDLTVDIMDKGRAALESYSWAENRLARGLLTWNRRKLGVVRSNGVTTYIGSRTSPLHCRIYDKNAESHGEIPASRIEIELKGEISAACTPVLRSYSGWTRLSGLFTNYLLKFGDWEWCGAIEALCYGDVTSVNLPDRDTEGDWEAWIRRQVLPGLQGTVGSREHDRKLWLMRLLREIGYEQSE